MLTNIVLDDRLVKEAFRYSIATTKKEVIHVALREFVQNHGRKDLREIRGKVAFVAGYDHKALRRETKS